MTITWKQFKEHVDKVLLEKEMSEETEIHYIDFSFVDDTKELIVAK